MLTQLKDIVDHVAKAESLGDALAVLVKDTRHVMQTECCSIYLMSNDNLCLNLMATEGVAVDLNLTSFSIDEGLVGLVARTHQPLNLANVSMHPAYKYISHITEYTFNSFLAVPIIHCRQTLGVLVVQQKNKRQFTEIEESFLLSLSAKIAAVFVRTKERDCWPAHLQIPQSRQKKFKGISTSNGIGIAPLCFIDPQPKIDSIFPSSWLDIELEKSRLETAIERTLKDFERARKCFEQDLSPEILAIFDLFTHLLNDPTLKVDFKKRIEEGDSAEWALRQVIEYYINSFEIMTDSYLKERACDIRELGQRLLHFLNHEDSLDIQFTHPIILATTQLTISILATIPRDKLKGIISLDSAANSHAVILSKALGIPTIIGAEFNLSHYNKSLTIVDGYSGLFYIKPSDPLVQKYTELQKEEIVLSELITQDINKLTLTLDNHLMNIYLDIGLSTDSIYTINQELDDTGLCRTKAMLERYSNKFDIGVYNPFLGWRDIRFTLAHPDVFLLQLKSIIRVNIGNDNFSITLPMISGIDELKLACVLINQAYEEVLNEYNQDFAQPLVGMMVEAPSMIYLLPKAAELIDFISVDTKDLTQYLLATDRDNIRLSDVYDFYHPAMLLVLKQIIESAKQYQLPVSVCGELAGDAIGCLLLMGLGYEHLSVNASNIAKVKYIIKQVTLAEMKTMLDRLLNHDDAKQILSEMVAFFKVKNLSAFIRTGN